ncbi:hypothetical protein [Wolbachia endosymbiont of Onchocerca gibsoni]|nr:hypothetical protein [Wolbachia endosymbiont of Onchocerca gibsoni]
MKLRIVLHKAITAPIKIPVSPRKIGKEKKPASMIYFVAMLA